MTTCSRQLISQPTKSHKFDRALSILFYGPLAKYRLTPVPPKKRSAVPIDPIFLNPPYGVFSRVARQLGVSPSHARKVALGLHVSAHVAAALIADVERRGFRLSEVQP